MNGSSSAIDSSSVRSGCGGARVDERVAVVAEHAEAVVEVEVHRRRLQVRRVVRVDADAAGLELGADVAVGEDAHRARFSLLRRAVLREQRVHLALEVLEVLEALVDGREPDVGDVVERAELVHRQRADPGAGHLGRARRAELRLDLVRGALGRIVGDGAPGQRLGQAGRQLVPVELLAGAVALDDDEARGLDALVRGEPRRCRPGTRGGGGSSRTRPGRASRRPGVSRVPHCGQRIGPPSSAHHYPLWCGARIPLHAVVEGPIGVDSSASTT